MSHHEMADTMADTAMTRAEYGTGSLYQRTSDWRWMGAVEHGYTASGDRRRISVSGKGCVGGCKKKCHHVAAIKRKIRDKKVELNREDNRPTKRTTSVARWGKDWLEAIQPKVTPNAFTTDKAAVRVITAAIGAKKLSDLTPGDVRAVARNLRKDGLSTSTALRYHGSLMRMLKAAMVEGYSVPPNVLLADKPVAAVNDREAIPTEKAIETLVHIAALPEERRARWAITFLQGHRQGESLGLTWPEIDLENETLRISWQLQRLPYIENRNPDSGFFIPDGYEARHLVGRNHLVRPKSDAGWRTQPLVPWATAALRAWREVAPENEHQLVWPGRTIKGATWPRNDASDRAEWYAMQESLGIKHPEGRPFKVHEIRHTTATLLLELGVDEGIRVAIMGHSTVASTKSYQHVDLTLQRQALQKAADRLALG